MDEVCWRRSKYTGNHGNCVEVAVAAGETAVRDSKAPHSGHLRVASRQWAAFLSRVKAGRCDT